MSEELPADALAVAHWLGNSASSAISLSASRSAAAAIPTKRSVKAQGVKQHRLSSAGGGAGTMVFGSCVVVSNFGLYLTE